MRLVTQLPDRDQDGNPISRALRRTDAGDEALRAYIALLVEDALAARFQLDRDWQDDLRRYEAVPRPLPEVIPFENAPNVEVALGAVACDAIYAQFIDTMFAAMPILTARPARGGDDLQRQVDVLQRRIDHATNSGEWNFRPTIEATCLDIVQLGTGGAYIPFVEQTRKTDIQRTKFRGAYAQPWPIEDILVDGGATTDIQRLPWVGLRAWMTEAELMTEARRGGWDVSQFIAGAGQDWVRTRRERLGRSERLKHSSLRFELVYWWGSFDYDEDGEDEDLFVVFDRSSRHLGYVGYGPYDTRPIEVGRYNLRAYLFYGQGVLSMARAGQETVTRLMNGALLNCELANAGLIATKEGSVPDDLLLHVAKQIPCQDPTNDIVPKQLGQPNPAIAQYIAMNISLTERRVGVNDMATPRPSQILGSRTPGITALSMLQQVNRRFTPAFDQMRALAAGIIKQCLWREQERLLAGDPELEDYYRTLLGDQDAADLMRLLRDPAFDESVTVELTASSASTNKDADRQAALMLTQILGQYYQKVIELTMLAANPQVPPAVQDVARKIADAGRRIIERTLRTFDQVRDVTQFTVDVGEEIDKLQLDQQAVMGLQGIMGALGLGAPGAQPPGATLGGEMAAGGPPPSTGTVQ